MVRNQGRLVPSSVKPSAALLHASKITRGLQIALEESLPITYVTLGLIPYQKATDVLEAQHIAFNLVFIGFFQGKMALVREIIWETPLLGNWVIAALSGHRWTGRGVPSTERAMWDSLIWRPTSSQSAERFHAAQRCLHCLGTTQRLCVCVCACVYIYTYIFSYTYIHIFVYEILSI